MLLREYAIEWWFVIPLLLTNVSALPGEMLKCKKCIFSLACSINALPDFDRYWLHLFSLVTTHGGSADVRLADGWGTTATTRVPRLRIGERPWEQHRIKKVPWTNSAKEKENFGHNLGSQTARKASAISHDRISVRISRTSSTAEYWREERGYNLCCCCCVAL